LTFSAYIQYNYDIINFKQEDNIVDMQKIGGFIAEERKAKSFTQKELAAMLNITDKAVSKWERGVSHS